MIALLLQVKFVNYTFRKVIQAIIPSFVYFIPILTEVIILVYSSVIGVRTSLQNEISMKTTLSVVYRCNSVAILSATIFSTITLHSIVHSITTVASSSSLRRTLKRIVWRHKNSHSMTSWTSPPAIAITIH